MRLRNIFALIIIFLAVLTAQTALAQEGGEISGSKLEIISPKDGEIITGDEILLNLRFSPEGGNHAHIWLDELNPSKDNAKSQETPGAVLFRDIKPGDHTIIVELAGDDHQLLDPMEKITLNVKTRSAADVTPEEIAAALKKVKPAEKETSNTNDNQSAQVDTKQTSSKSSSLIIIISVAGVIIVGGGIGFFIIRSKKQ